eukprot:TRINITY_DN224_c0_g1_i1.p1 TRINITY_DN224_c0_g1~~TRINITY_DN224_c0_g1_i1.p1  ORF type:complete len:575 (-),score=347.29 TRINITY_DN224_c0_g1_i1:53-1777(-)
MGKKKGRGKGNQNTQNNKSNEPENQTENAEENVESNTEEKVEENVERSEEKVEKSEENAVKSEENAEKSEEKVEENVEKVEKVEEKVENSVGKDEVVLHREEIEEKQVEESVAAQSSSHPAVGKDEIALHNQEEEKSEEKEEESEEKEVEEEFGASKEQVAAAKVHFEEKVEIIPIKSSEGNSDEKSEKTEQVEVNPSELKEMKKMAERALTHEPSPILQSDQIKLEEKMEEENLPKIPSKRETIPFVQEKLEENSSNSPSNYTVETIAEREEKKEGKLEEKNEKKKGFSANKSGEWEPTGFPSESKNSTSSPQLSNDENPYATYDSEFENVQLNPEENKAWEEMYNQVQKEKSLVIPKSRREILKYLMAKKFNKEKALTVMYSYMNMRQMTLPGDILMVDVERFLRTKAVICPPNARDKEGRKVIFGTPRYISTQGGTIMDRAKGLFYIMEKEIKSVESQKNGFTFVLDMRRARPNSVGRQSMKVLTDVFEDSFPAKFKQVLIVEAPWWFEIAYAITKPFLKPKLTSRVKIVNLNQLQNLIDPQQLPSTLGGKSTFDQDKWIDQMKTLEANSN